jgi:hypothetical protein
MSSSASLEKWAYVMIIIVCFAILLSIIFYFISILYKHFFARKSNNSRNRSNSELINKNGTKNSRDNTTFAHVSSEDCLCHLSANSKEKCVYCEKRAETERTGNTNSYSKSNSMNRNIIGFNGHHTFDAGNGYYQDRADFKAKKFTSLNLAFDPMTLNTTTANAVTKEQPPPSEPTGMLAQLINKIKHTLFTEVDTRGSGVGEETHRTSSDKNVRSGHHVTEKLGSSFRRASVTPSAIKSSIKRNSTTSANSTTTSFTNNRKSSLASNATTGTVHSVKFKANSAAITKKKRSLKSNGSSSLKGSSGSGGNKDCAVHHIHTYCSTTEDDSEEMDDHFEVDKDNELLRQQQQRYNSGGILAKRDTLSSLASSSKKNSLANSDYYSSRKSSNSSCMESSVVDLYRQKRFSSDAASSSSQFTNSINSSTFNVKPPSHMDTGFRVVALEQQPSVGHLSESSSTQQKSSWCAKKKASLTSNSSAVSYPETAASRARSVRKHSMASAFPQQQNPGNIYDKFWVPPEIAKLAKLDKQRSSLPNTNIPVYDTILEVNEKLAVPGSPSPLPTNRSPSPRMPYRSNDANTGKLTFLNSFVNF